VVVGVWLVVVARLTLMMGTYVRCIGGEGNSNGEMSWFVVLQCIEYGGFYDDISTAS